MEIIVSLLFPWLTSALLFHCSVCLFPSSPGPLYGSLMKAWQCFFTSTERLSELHSSISQALITEEGQRVKTWQKETFPKKIFCGFKESHDNNTSFSRAQKPWSKKLIKVQNTCNTSFTFTCYTRGTAYAIGNLGRVNSHSYFNDRNKTCTRCVIQRDYT